MIWEDLETRDIPYMVIEYTPCRWWPFKKGRLVRYEILAPADSGLEPLGFRAERWPRRYRGRIVRRYLSDREADRFVERGTLPTLWNRYGCIWDRGLKKHLSADCGLSCNKSNV